MRFALGTKLSSARHGMPEEGVRGKRMALQADQIAEQKVHPEHESLMRFIAKRWWNALFHPVIRLPLLLPWGLKEFSKIYAMAALIYVVGSIVPILIVFGIAMAAIQIAPLQMWDVVATADGHPNMNVLLAAMIGSFICGFGAELLYINQQLKKKGMSLGQVMGLNLNSLGGSWRRAFRYASVALVIALAAQNLMDFLPALPKPHQATADMASHLHGGGLMAFTALAALAAPFFEEIIFRGCVFNAFRNIMREGRIFKMLKQNPRVADYLAISASAFLFALAHMDWTAFPQLFILGVILAEVYRRSGSLVCPMLLHAMNNAVATLLIVFKTTT